MPPGGIIEWSWLAAAFSRNNRGGMFEGASSSDRW
jgi:hypothetical protein